MAFGDSVTLQTKTLQVEMSEGTDVGINPLITIKMMDDDPQPAIIMDRDEAQDLIGILNFWVKSTITIKRSGCICNSEDE